MRKSKCDKKINKFCIPGGKFIILHKSDKENRILFELVETFDIVGDTISYSHLKYYIKDESYHCDISLSSCLKNVFAGTFIHKNTKIISNADYMAMYSKAANMFITTDNYLRCYDLLKHN